MSKTDNTQVPAEDIQHITEEPAVASVLPHASTRHQEIMESLHCKGLAKACWWKSALTKQVKTKSAHFALEHNGTGTSNPKRKHPWEKGNLNNTRHRIVSVGAMPRVGHKRQTWLGQHGYGERAVQDKSDTKALKDSVSRDSNAQRTEESGHNFSCAPPRGTTLQSKG